MKRPQTKAVPISGGTATSSSLAPWYLRLVFGARVDSGQVGVGRQGSRSTDGEGPCADAAPG